MDREEEEVRFALRADLQPALGASASSSTDLSPKKRSLQAFDSLDTIVAHKLADAIDVRPSLDCLTS